jgi:hypothetical protein
MLTPLECCLASPLPLPINIHYYCNSKNSKFFFTNNYSGRLLLTSGKGIQQHFWLIFWKMWIAPVFYLQCFGQWFSSLLLHGTNRILHKRRSVRILTSLFTLIKVKNVTHITYFFIYATNTRDSLTLSCKMVILYICDRICCQYSLSINY